MSGWLVLVRELAAADKRVLSRQELTRRVSITFDDHKDIYMFERAEALGLIEGRPFQRGDCPEAAFVGAPLRRVQGRPMAWRLTAAGWLVAHNKMRVAPPSWLTPTPSGGRAPGTKHRLVPTWLSALPEGVRLAPTGCTPGAIELAPDDPRLAGLPDGALVVIRRQSAAAP